jgi:hypothetical protein
MSKKSNIKRQNKAEKRKGKRKGKRKLPDHKASKMAGGNSGSVEDLERAKIMAYMTGHKRSERHSILKRDTERMESASRYPGGEV